MKLFLLHSSTRFKARVSVQGLCVLHYTLSADGRCVSVTDWFPVYTLHKVHAKITRRTEYGVWGTPARDPGTEIKWTESWCLFSFTLSLSVRFIVSMCLKHYKWETFFRLILIFIFAGRNRILLLRLLRKTWTFEAIMLDKSWLMKCSLRCHEQIVGLSFNTKPMRCSFLRKLKQMFNDEMKFENMEAEGARLEMWMCVLKLCWRENGRVNVRWTRPLLDINQRL